ncbi:unnamed protein product [Cyprideis torosa]|uniref:Uncharacterized protein n=1 Tax=Cyprideis torosa TaxID=163714 RepID=A0A7R8WD25_9CRUS|nr:unnamed protein product [Cyprideis torosa]CAG0888502.1 unnamed protein product [Cyprideis torosa]
MDTSFYYDHEQGQAEAGPRHRTTASSTHNGLNNEDEFHDLRELQESLRDMKQLLSDTEVQDVCNSERTRRKKPGPKSQTEILDVNAVSAVFGLAMLMVVGVTFYAFYHLYTAVMRKFAERPHTP